MARRIVVRIVPAGDTIRFSGGVTIECNDGPAVSTFVAEADGTGSRRLDESRVVGKFAATAGSVLAPAARDRLAEMILSVDRIDDVTRLAAACTIPGLDG
jgi:hypothetical protein